MKLKQGIVNCLCNDFDNGGIAIQRPTKGWLTVDGEFGYCKVNATTWKAIDIETGTSVCAYTTRKECMAWVEDNLELIRNHPSRAKWIEIKKKAPIREAKNGT